MKKIIQERGKNSISSIFKRKNKRINKKEEDDRNVSEEYRALAQEDIIRKCLYKSNLKDIVMIRDSLC